MREVEIREGAAGPRLYGVLIQEGRAARRRREVFVPNSIQWPSDGVGILLKHYGDPEVRAIPERQPDGRITLQARATDPIRQAVAGGRRFMSVEFHALRERRTEGGVREVLRAMVPSVALVPRPEYSQSSAEVRQRGGYRTRMSTGTRADCKCPDGDAREVEFGADAFVGVENLDVTAISRGAESVLASTSTGSLRLRRGADGALDIDIDPLDTEAGRRTRELLEARQPVYARPLWMTDQSVYEIENGVALVSFAWFQYMLVRPVPEADAQGLDALSAEEGRAVLLTLKRRALLASAA